MQLCIALDLPDSDSNLKLLEMVRSHPLWVKVGLRSYIRDGKPFLDEILKINPDFRIFLDLKLYDIPKTMADAAAEVADLGVGMFTLHASSGMRAMQAVRARLDKCHNPPLALAVTVLTSFDEQEFASIYNDVIPKSAEKFAIAAHVAGMDGVVCSVHESREIKAATGGSFITLTPGIRPLGGDAGDQKRVATVEDAKTAKSDYIVMGRPIYEAQDPEGMVKTVLNGME